MTLKYAGPCILHNDLIITNTNSYAESAGAFFLLDGRQKMVHNPLTGSLQPWKMTRAYGCNNIIASENLLTFRSGAAGFYDLLTDSRHWQPRWLQIRMHVEPGGGQRSSECARLHPYMQLRLSKPNLFGAGAHAGHGTLERGYLGVRSSRTAKTMELWVSYDSVLPVIGAAGKEDFGLSIPVVSGESPPSRLTWTRRLQPYQHHSSVHAGRPLSWVLASGEENVTSVRLAI